MTKTLRRKGGNSRNGITKNPTNHINKDNYFVIKMEIVFVDSRRVRQKAEEFMVKRRRMKKKENLIKIYNAGRTLRHQV